MTANAAGYAQLQRALERTLRDRVAPIIVSRAYRNANHGGDNGTGHSAPPSPRLAERIAGKIETRTKRGMVIIGTFNDEVLVFHELGTGIYGPTGLPIRPVKSQYLSWVGADGKRIFARSVKGVADRHWLRNAAQKPVTTA